MPGHDKGILFSYLAQERRRFRHALGFIVTFTVTHLIDVVILSFGLKLLSSAYRSATVSQILKLIGGAGLIIIAVFMIFLGIQDLIKTNASLSVKAEEKKTPRIGGAAILGLLTGLARRTLLPGHIHRSCRPGFAFDQAGDHGRLDLPTIEIIRSLPTNRSLRTSQFLSLS